MQKYAVVKVPSFLSSSEFCSTMHVNSRTVQVLITDTICTSVHRSSDTWCLHYLKLTQVMLFIAHCSCWPFQRMSFSTFVLMRTCSLIPRPNSMITGLGKRLTHKQNDFPVNHTLVRTYSNTYWLADSATPTQHVSNTRLSHFSCESPAPQDYGWHGLFL